MNTQITMASLYQSKVRNKTWESHFSLVWVMELLVKTKLFLKTLTCQTQLTFNVSMKTVIKCVFNWVYTLFKKTFLLSHTAFLRRFIYSRVGILDSPWCNIFCRAYQELGNGDFYSFGQEKVPFLVISLFPSFLNCNLPTHKKCNHQKNYTYLNLSITFVIKWTYTSL